MKLSKVLVDDIKQLELDDIPSCPNGHGQMLLSVRFLPSGQAWHWYCEIINCQTRAIL